MSAVFSSKTVEMEQLTWKRGRGAGFSQSYAEKLKIDGLIRIKTSALNLLASFAKKVIS